MTALPLPFRHLPSRIAHRLASGPLHRAAALTLLLLLVPPPFLAALAGLSALAAQFRQETAAAETEAALYRALAARGESLREALVTRQAALAASALFPQTPAPGPALAALQSALGDRAAASGVEISRILPGEPEEADGTTWLRLGLEVEGEAEAALAFLSAIESGTPLILFRRAEIRRQDRTDAAQAGRTRLRLVLDLAAPWRAGAGE